MPLSTKLIIFGIILALVAGVLYAERNKISPVISQFTAQKPVAANWESYTDSEKNSHKYLTQSILSAIYFFSKKYVKMRNAHYLHVQTYWTVV